MSLKENDILYESKRETEQEPKGYAKQLDDYAQQFQNYGQQYYQPMPPELFKQLLKGLTPIDNKNKPETKTTN